MVQSPELYCTDACESNVFPAFHRKATKRRSTIRRPTSRQCALHSVRTVLAGGSYWYLKGSNTFSAMVGFFRLYCGIKSATTGVISHPSACRAFEQTPQYDYQLCISTTSGHMLGASQHQHMTGVCAHQTCAPSTTHISTVITSHDVLPIHLTEGFQALACSVAVKHDTALQAQLQAPLPRSRLCATAGSHVHDAIP